MPAIAWPRATAAQLSRDRGAELQYPSAHRFIGDVEPSFGQQLLDIAVAQGEAEIKPDRVLDDLGREAMAVVAERSHADILSDPPLTPDPVSVTMPLEAILAPARIAETAPFFASLLSIPTGGPLSAARIERGAAAAADPGGPARPAERTPLTQAPHHWVEGRRAWSQQPDLG